MGERTDACEARVEECKEVAERAALRGHKPIGATLAWVSPPWRHGLKLPPTPRDWSLGQSARAPLQPGRLTNRSAIAIVKAHVSRAGLYPTLLGRLLARIGFLTSAAARGAAIFKRADH